MDKQPKIRIEDIYPLTEFQRNAHDFLVRMKQSRAPIVLTVNGKAEVVVQDAVGYQEILDRLERAEAVNAIREGIADFEKGNDIDADEAFAQIRRSKMNDMWQKAEKLNGKTLHTIAQNKPFDILAVTPDRIVFSPQSGNGSKRWFPRDSIEHIWGMGLREEEVTPGRMSQEWPNDQNTSYIAAIVRELMKK